MNTGMAGRPPLPIAIKQAQGNTRKVGKDQFRAEVSDAWQAQRGRPPMPMELRGPTAKQLVEEQGDAEAYVKLKATADRMASAQRHWRYVTKQLAADGLLAMLDQGVLTGLCLNFAGMIETAREGRWRDFAELEAKYTAAADRCGLNESARARLPRRAAPKVDPLEEALSRDLPEPLQ